MSGWASGVAEEGTVPDELLNALEIDSHEHQQPSENLEVSTVSFGDMQQLADITEEEAAEWIGEDDGTIEWRYQLWEMTGNYPENVGYVVLHEDQETYIIGLVENTDEQQSNILEHVPQSTNIEFEEATYSHNELQAVQEEVKDEWIEHANVFGVGVGWRQEDGEVIGFGESGNEMRVVVQAAPEEVDTLTEQLEAEYGDKVFVEPSEGVATFEEEVEESAEEAFIEDSADEAPQMDEQAEEAGEIEEAAEEALYLESTTPPQAPDSGDQEWLFHMMIFTSAALVVLVLYYFIRNGSLRVKQFVTGEQADETPALSKDEVEKRVSESKFEPSDEVYHNLMEKMFDEKE